MSKLKELIDKLCPDGVEYKKLGDVCFFADGLPIKADDIKEQGLYPVIKIGNIINGIVVEQKHYLTELPPKIKKSQILEGGEILVGMSGSTGKTGYNSLQNAVVNQRIAIIRNRDLVLNGYLKHCLVNNNFESYCFQIGNGPQHNISKFDLLTFEIPLPPIEVQEEIVRILDNFTKCTAELQAELQAREEQYEYYKWNIFEGLSCPTKHITDVALVKARVGWQRLTTAEYQSIGDYYLITGTDFKNGKIDFGNCVFVSKERYEMDPNIIVGKGDILITKDGTLGKVAFLEDEPNKPTTLNSGVFRIHTTDPKVSPRYLFHYFTSKYFTDFVNSVKTGSTIPHLTQQGLVSLNIPIPSLEEQNRVVSILDRFDTLTTDITTGLPAEIEARQNQYEFYRNRLLSFKRLTT